MLPIRVVKEAKHFSWVALSVLLFVTGGLGFHKALQEVYWVDYMSSHIPHLICALLISFGLAGLIASALEVKISFKKSSTYWMMGQLVVLSAFMVGYQEYIAYHTYHYLIGSLVACLLFTYLFFFAYHLDLYE